MRGTLGGDVFKSTDGGASWSPPVSTGVTQITSLAVDPVTPTVIYAGTYAGGVFMSINEGVTWNVVNSGLASTNVRALAIDPVTPTSLYAGTFGGVFKSSNGGITWSEVNSGGLTNTDILALAIAPTTPTATVYAGTSGGGVFKSTDGGASWAAVGGLADTLKTVFSLAIDPATGTVYAGTYGGGVFVLECTFARQLIVMDTSCCQMPGPASGSFEQNICVASPETRLFLDRICTFPSDSNNPCGQAGPNGCAVCWSVPYTNYCHVHDDPNNPTVCAYEFE